MTWLIRHSISVSVVAVALVVVGAVFTFARPGYHPTSSTTTVYMTSQDHYTVEQVERAFASHAIRLGEMSHDGNTKHGLIILGPARRGKPAPSAFTVTLFGTESKVMFGPDNAMTYNERFGNVDVSYGYPNPDEALLGRIKAAVTDLRQ